MKFLAPFSWIGCLLAGLLSLALCCWRARKAVRATAQKSAAEEELAAPASEWVSHRPVESLTCSAVRSGSPRWFWMERFCDGSPSGWTRPVRI